MTLQTQKVTVQLLDASGNPVVGATVTAKLDQTDYYTGGTITPVLLSQTTDATGSTVFTIWPNALGTMGSTYHFRAWAPGTNARLLDVFASVPARDCNLQDILNLTPVPVNSWALAVDTNNGIVGKTNGQINFYDAAHTELSYLVNHATAQRTYTFPDRSITVAGLDDIASMQANVAITGGTIKGVALTLDNLDNTPVGANTPSTVKATTLTATGLATLQSRTLVNGATDDGGTALQVLGAGKFSDAVTTRSNLGLGTMATQAASAVALTGGSMDGVTIGATTPAAITGTLGRFTGAVSGTLAGKSLEIGLNGSTGFVQAYDRTNSVALDLVFGAIGSLKISAGGRILVNGATDDGSTALQVAGGASFTNTILTKMGTARIQLQSTTNGVNAGIFANTNDSGGVQHASGVYFYPNAVGLSADNNNINLYTFTGGRVAIGVNPSDNGTDALQVAGSGSFSSNLNVNSSIRAAGNNAPTSGQGMEVYYAGGVGYATAFDRTGGAYLPAALQGSDVTLNANGSGRHLHFNTQGTERGRWTDAGRLLIGTTTDNGSDALQVNGSCHVSSILGIGAASVSGYALNINGGYTLGLNLVNTNASGYGVAIQNGNDANYSLAINNAANNAQPIRLYGNGKGYFQGPILIGTTTDNGADALQVTGSIISGIHTISGSGSATTSLQFYDSAAGANLKIWHIEAATGTLYLSRYDDNNSSNARAVLALVNAGRVLINTGTDNGGDALQVNGSCAFYGTIKPYGIQPQSDNAYNNGTTALRWATVYSVNGVVTTSDRRLKTDFADSLGLDFINQLNPVSYRWRDNDNGIHHGLVAQEVDALLDRLGVKSFAGLSKPDEGHMGLNYSEFIAPLIKSVQELSKRVKMLEAVAA